MKRNLSFEILFSLGLLLSASGSAVAGVSDAIKVDATPLANPVTYSDTFQSTNRRKVTTTSVLDSFVVYKVTITNRATNTVNNIVFKGTTTVDVIENGKPLAATYDTVESPDGMISCDTGGDTTVSCSIGQLRSDGSVTFWLYFKAPKNENGVDPALPEELVDFSYWVLYSEGPNDSSDNPNDSSAVQDADPVELGTPNPMLVVSGVPSGKKVTLFSGNGLFAEPELRLDGFVVSPAAQTNVTIPAGASAATTELPPTATIAQIPITAGCKHFVTCYESNLTIPTVDTGADAPGGLFLSILVRIDASNLVKGLKFSDIQPVYIDESGPPRNVYKCVVLANGKYAALPCWTDGNQIKNPQDPNEDGDVYWLFINNKNGGYAFF